MARHSQSVNPSSKAQCLRCPLREHCIPTTIAFDDLDKFEELVATRKRIKRDEALYRAGDKFEALYAVRLGFLKSTVTTQTGLEQVINFPMAGEIVGLDGIANDVHCIDAVALEDTEVCVIPYAAVASLEARFPDYLRHIQKTLSRELVRQHGLDLLLGSLRAEERIAAFLLNLSQRFESRGYSKSEFVLRMTRANIGSYLGLQLETVSRILSRFADDGLITVNQKHIQILDFAALRAIVAGQERFVK